MTAKEVKSGLAGTVGYLEEIKLSEPDSLLVFQLPRPTNMLSDVYVSGAMKSLRECLPEGRKALVIGGDVNIYELTGSDAVVLKLKGILI